MSRTLRRTNLKDWFEMVGESCPICGKSGGCIIHTDGNRIACIRVESDVLFSQRLTSYLHYLKKPVKVSQDVQDYVPANPKAPVEVLNAVYGALIENCHLKTEHYEHLTGASRAMQNSEIKERMYRSFPAKPWNTLKAVQDHIDAAAFEGVPGLFTNKYGWSISGAPGILIPYRNERNQITGFQIRVDNPGFKTVTQGTFKDKVTAEIIEKPNLVQVKINGKVFKEERLSLDESIELMGDGNFGSVTLKKGQRYFWLSSVNKEKGTGAGNPLPIHVAVPSTKLANWNVGEVHESKSVWITEGALKADIAVEHMERIYRSGLISDQENSPTILGLPGVSTWYSVMPMLKAMKTSIVTLAYDMDILSNQDVLKAMKDFMLHLKKEGYIVRVAMWDEKDGKGIDDMFLNSKFPQVRTI